MLFRRVPRRRQRKIRSADVRPPLVHRAPEIEVQRHTHDAVLHPVRIAIRRQPQLRPPGCRVCIQCQSHVQLVCAFREQRLRPAVVIVGLRECRQSERPFRSGSQHQPPRTLHHRPGQRQRRVCVRAVQGSLSLVRLVAIGFQDATQCERERTRFHLRRQRLRPFRSGDMVVRLLIALHGSQGKVCAVGCPQPRQQGIRHTGSPIPLSAAIVLCGDTAGILRIHVGIFAAGMVKLRGGKDLEFSEAL